MIRLGVFIMIVSIIGFIGFTVAPLASPDVRKALEPYVCDAGETLEVSVSRYRPGETSYSLYCDGDGISSSTDGLLLGSMLVFFVLLGLSILLIIRGSVAATRHQHINLQQQVDRMMGGNAQVYSVDMGDGVMRGTRRSVQINFSDPNNPSVTETPDDGGNSGDSLAEKLRQLQDAFEANLLTQEEYDRQRQKILDDF